MSLRFLKIFAVLGVIAAVVLVQDFFRFTWACRTFAERAALGPEQLAVGKKMPEALVVITGDKNRIPKALDLLSRAPESWLLISGVSKKTHLNELVALHGGSDKPLPGIEGRVLIDSQATSTMENAEETEKLLQKKNIQEMVLVTSDYHMVRALGIFKRKVTATVIPYAVSSDLTEGLSGWPVLAFKFVIEYWKWVAFRFNIY
ncbi:YdcF family protein [bacterium]|nr:YdcF family protein [bacterium]NBX82799.1 YdcF family protein [bacterium]